MIKKLYFVHDASFHRSIIGDAEIRRTSGHSYFLDNLISIKIAEVDKIGSTFHTTKLKAVQEEMRRCRKKKKEYVKKKGFLTSKLEQLRGIEVKMTPEE